MQFEWDDHFAEIVLPAWQDYLQAERGLSQATYADDAARRRAASFTALRLGASAAVFLHHYAEVVVRSMPRFIPQGVTDVTDARRWLAPHCLDLRSTAHSDDVALLGDVADALKHCVLTRRVPARLVSTTNQVLVVATNYGATDNFCGEDQVVVLPTTGSRPLSTVLQNVIDAWRRAAGCPLPEVGVS